MKRDFEVVRRLMLELEARDEQGPLGPMQVGPDRDFVERYHARLIVEAGLAHGVVSETLQGDTDMSVWLLRLTWAGHEFLDAARPEDRWQLATARLGQRAGQWTLQALNAVLVNLMTEAALRASGAR